MHMHAHAHLIRILKAIEYEPPFFFLLSSSSSSSSFLTPAFFLFQRCFVYITAGDGPRDWPPSLPPESHRASWPVSWPVSWLVSWSIETSTHPQPLSSIHRKIMQICLKHSMGSEARDAVKSLNPARLVER